MSESAEHLQLVCRILRFIETNFPPERFIVCSDAPGSFDKPPRIAGFVPDVFATDAPRTTVVVGEAKTAADLQTAHSQRQISEFVRFVAAQQRGIFLLAVPWQAGLAARRVLNGVQFDWKRSTPTLVILDGITGRAATASSS
jgi:hypothetical protein